MKKQELINFYERAIKELSETLKNIDKEKDAQMGISRKLADYKKELEILSNEQ